MDRVSQNTIWRFILFFVWQFSITLSQINSTSGFEQKSIGCQDSLLPRLSEEFGGAGDVAGTRPGAGSLRSYPVEPERPDEYELDPRRSRGVSVSKPRSIARSSRATGANPGTCETDPVAVESVSLRETSQLRRLWNFLKLVKPHARRPRRQVGLRARTSLQSDSGRDQESTCQR